MATVVTSMSTTDVRVVISRVHARHEMLYSHEPLTCHHRVFLWQAFPRDYPTP